TMRLPEFRVVLWPGSAACNPAAARRTRPPYARLRRGRRASRRSGGSRTRSWCLLPGAADRHLDVGVPPAVDQTNFERITGLLVDLRDAVVWRGRAAHMAPAAPRSGGP